MKTPNFKDDVEACDFLESRGFIKDGSPGGYFYLRSNGVKRQLDQDEMKAVNYLFEEWDYGFN